jgi:hypothetical protein
MIISFISLFIIFYVGIDLFRKFTKKEKWDVLTTVGYSAIIALMVMVVLTLIVVLF